MLVGVGVGQKQLGKHAQSLCSWVWVLNATFYLEHHGFNQFQMFSARAVRKTNENVLRDVFRRRVQPQEKAKATPRGEAEGAACVLYVGGLRNRTALQKSQIT